jgi:stage II sporulation protein M
MSYKKWAIVAGIVLAAGIIAGAVNQGNAGVFTTYIETLKELAGGLQPASTQMFVFILTQNVTALVISYVFSPFLLIIPLLALVVNGWLLGFISVGVVEQRSIFYLLAGILPHGIFELPALVIAQAAAFNFGGNTLTRLITKKKGVPVFDSFRRNGKYLLLALVLLVAAALIETWVTPLLLKALGQ